MSGYQRISLVGNLPITYQTAIPPQRRLRYWIVGYLMIEAQYLMRKPTEAGYPRLTFPL
jgi:hypothetical protein